MPTDPIPAARDAPPSTTALPTAEPSKRAKQVTSFSSSDFPKYWRYAIEHDFALPATGEAAQYAPGHPKYRDADEASKLSFEKRVSSLSLNADCTLLAFAVGTEVHIYAVETRELVKLVKGHINPISAVIWHPLHPREFVTSSPKSDLRSFDDAEDNDKQRSEIVFWNLDDIIEHPLDEDIVNEMASAALETITVQIAQHSTTDSSALPWTLTPEDQASLSKTIRTKLQQSHTVYLRGHSPTIHGTVLKRGDSSCFSPDGNSLLYLAGERQGSNGDHPWPLAIFDIATGSRKVTLNGHTDTIMYASFSPSGSLVGTASWDGTFRLFDAITAQAVHIFRSYDDPEKTCQNWAAAFSPDGIMFAGSTGTGFFRVWQIDTGKVLGSWMSKGSQKRWCRSVSWSGDGRYLAAGARGLGSIVVVEPGMQVSTTGQTGEDGGARSESDEGNFRTDEVQRRQLSLSACVGLDGQEHIPRFIADHLETTQLSYGRGKCAHKLAYKVAGDRGLEVYDHVKNIKWRFAAREEEELTMRSNDGWGDFLWLEDKEQIVSVEGSVVRFWDVSG